MSRFRLFLHSVASSSLVLGGNIVYSLVSVPLALHFLGRSEFALWALLSQISGYMALIDFGMSPSVSRLLIEHKDRPQDGLYGSLIQTGFLVTAAQGLLIFAVGYLLAPSCCALMQIPDHLRDAFNTLIRWQCALTGANFATRMFRHLLYSHQRNDLVNYSQLCALVASLFTLCFALHEQFGVYSIVLANAASLLFGILIGFGGCLSLRLFPPRGAWGQPTWSQFKELFAYGKDVFLVHFGSQLTMAAQPVIVSRNLGLEAVATWAVGTKAFTLMVMMIEQLFDYSAPAFSEMMVRGESERLRKRFVGVLIVSATLAGAAAVVYAGCNSAFVTVWTAGKISWPWWNDVLLGIWLVVLAVVHCNCAFVIITKDIAFMRYVFLLEGICFVILASWAAPYGKIASVIAASIVSSLCFSGIYGTVRVNRYFSFRCPELELQYLVPFGRILLLLAPVAAAVMFVTGLFSPVTRLAANAAVLASFGCFAMLRLGVPADLQQDLLQRCPPRVAPWLRRAFNR